MNRRIVAGTAVLATFAFGCRSGAAPEDAVLTTVSSVTTPASVSAVDVAPVGAVLDRVAWPDGLLTVPVAQDAQHQLTALLGEDPRVAPFVLDAAAVGLGRGRDAVGAVLAVRVSAGAAVDPAFRTSAAAALVGVDPDPHDEVWIGADVAAVWHGSVMMVVTVEPGEELSPLVEALASLRDLQ